MTTRIKSIGYCEVQYIDESEVQYLDDYAATDYTADCESELEAIINDEYTCGNFAIVNEVECFRLYSQENDAAEWE